jgi:phospholipid-binding lipoprotein MlaA
VTASPVAAGVAPTDVCCPHRAFAAIALAAVVLVVEGCTTLPPETAAAARIEVAAASISAAGAVSAAGDARADVDPDARPSPRSAAVDPLEPINRGVARFNDTVDAWVLRPVARVYDRWTPEVIRMIGRNVLSNLLDPYIALNNFLQGKPSAGFSDLGRFVFNTTFGFLGFGDPASDVGLEKHREDFGQTLGVWGVPTGPYLVLPLFGPSNVRDGLGFGVDAWAALINRFDNVPLRNSVAGVQFVETRAQLLPADRLLQEALDRYLLVRDSYLQRRRNQVFDGSPPQDDD